MDIPPSQPASSSHLVDESDAVFFGDFTSPERKFTFLFPNADAAACPQSPDNDFEFEQRSILAHRVVSSHTNPSPPPSPSPKDPDDIADLVAHLLSPSTPPSAFVGASNPPSRIFTPTNGVTTPKASPLLPASLGLGEGSSTPTQRGEQTVQSSEVDNTASALGNVALEPSIPVPPQKQPEHDTHIPLLDILSPQPLQAQTTTNGLEDSAVIPPASSLPQQDASMSSPPQPGPSNPPLQRPLSPAPSVNDQSMVDSSLQQEGGVPDQAGEGERGRSRDPGQTGKRAIRSLSPNSSDLLMRLLPGESEPAASPDKAGPSKPSPAAQIFPPSQALIFDSEVAPVSLRTNSPVRSQPPVRFSSPARYTSPLRSSGDRQARFPSPGKSTGPIRFAPPSSPLKPPPFEPSAASTPSRPPTSGFPRKLPSTPLSTKRLVTGNPPGSLLRPTPSRVGSSSLSQISSTPLKSSSLRSLSLEPQPQAQASQLRAKPNSLSAIPEATSQQPDPQPLSRVGKPRPVSPAKPQPEARRNNSQTSSLKQTTSRIPRIGSKPYSRHSSLIPAPSLKVRESEPSNKAVVIKPVVVAKAPPTSAPNPPQANSAPTTEVKIPKPITAEPSTTLGSKRKRDTQSDEHARTPSTSTNGVRVQRMTTTPFVIRKVEVPPPLPKPEEPPAAAAAAAAAAEAVSLPVDTQPLTIRIRPVRESQPETEPILEPPSSQPEAVEDLTPIPLPGSSDGSETETASAPISGVRRTSRLRKPVTTQSTIIQEPVAPKPRRRPRSTAEDDPLSGYSAMQLRTLTTANTLKNEKYLVANLETEIIRKMGNRPISPPPKFATGAQKQEAETQRKERAERRARRNSGEEEPCEEIVADIQDTADCVIGDHSMEVSDQEEGSGSSDTDERPSKRTKSDMEIAENYGERGEGRRVRWNSGLFTSIYLDQVHPNGRARREEFVGVKGCLADRAKTLNLDTLGNLTNINEPLLDLEPEHIIIQKFVYDDDPVPVPPPPPRATRSKSRKK